MLIHTIIRRQQQAWAYDHGIKFDRDGYTQKLEDNLFCPLSPETEKEFSEGAGNELGDGDSRGKMQALHSSSALVVNVFEYWRHKDVEFIARACGSPKGVISLNFERTFPTPLSGTPPHIDVEFYNTMFSPLVIEAKFTEHYHRKTKRRIKGKYLDSNLWKGLPKCESLVRLISEEEKAKTQFSFLDAPQLLKHLLGLVTKYGRGGFELLYLWYDYPSLEAEKHRQEVREFANHVYSEVHFRDMTFQELSQRIEDSSKADREYTGYLNERYFH